MAEGSYRLGLTPHEYFKLKRLMAALELAESDNVKGIYANIGGCGKISWIPGEKISIEFDLDDPHGE